MTTDHKTEDLTSKTLSVNRSNRIFYLLITNKSNLRTSAHKTHLYFSTGVILQSQTTQRYHQFTAQVLRTIPKKYFLLLLLLIHFSLFAQTAFCPFIQFKPSTTLCPILVNATALVSALEF